MGVQIERILDGGSIAYAQSSTDIGPFKTEGMTQMWVNLPSDFNGDTMTLKGSLTEGGTYTTLQGSDYTWAGVTGWNLIPPTAMVFPFLKVVTGTGTAAAGSMEYCRKS